MLVFRLFFYARVLKIKQQLKHLNFNSSQLDLSENL